MATENTNTPNTENTENTQRHPDRSVMNLIILDKSGSMASIRQEAVEGVNHTLAAIRSAGEETSMEQRVTLVAFCSCEHRKLIDYAPIENVAPLQPDEYRPCCGTPLYDAIGHNCTALARRLAHRTGVAVNVTIITDGYENSSRKWSGGRVKALIEQLKAKGWTFAFIGANVDVEAVSFSLSIDNAMQFSSDAESTRAMFAQESRSRRRWNRRLANLSDEEFARPEPRCSIDYFEEEDKKKGSKDTPDTLTRLLNLFR